MNTFYLGELHIKTKVKDFEILNLPVQKQCGAIEKRRMSY